MPEKEDIILNFLFPRYINVVYNNKPVYTTEFKLTIPESDGRINILEKKVEALEQGTILPEETIKWIALGDSITSFSQGRAAIARINTIFVSFR